MSIMSKRKGNKLSHWITHKNKSNDKISHNVKNDFELLNCLFLQNS